MIDYNFVSSFFLKTLKSIWDFDISLVYIFEVKFVAQIMGNKYVETYFNFICYYFYFYC